MGLAIAIVDNIVVGNKRKITADLTFDSSYPTGGEPVTLASLGLASLTFADLGSKGANTFAYDYTNNKLLAYVSSTGVQVANAVDLSAVSIRVQFEGQ